MCTSSTIPAPSIVHLVAPPSACQNHRSHIGRLIPTLLLSAALENALTPPPPHSLICIIGDTSTKISARALHLPQSTHLVPVISNPNTLKRPLIRRLKLAPPSRILCWSDELLGLASAVASSLDIPLELLSTKPSLISKPPHNIDAIRVFANADHDRWQDLRHTCQSDRLITPLIDPEPPTPVQRAAARNRVGIDEQTIVVAAIADNPSDVDAREFAFLLGLLAVSGYKTLGIVPNTARNLNQALRHHRGLDQPFRMMVTRDQLPAILPLLNAYIHPTDEGSGSTELLDRFLERADVHKLNLRHSGKAGFSRAQGTAGQLLDEMDLIVDQLQSQFSTA